MTDNPSEFEKMVRPKWCLHKDCIYVRCFQKKMCSGILPNPEKHDDDYNTHRICLMGALSNNEAFDLQINKTDVYYFRLLFEVINEKQPNCRFCHKPFDKEAHRD